MHDVALRSGLVRVKASEAVVSLCRSFAVVPWEFANPINNSNHSIRMTCEYSIRQITKLNPNHEQQIAGKDEF